MEKVDLRLAYNWTCPECGRDKFEYSIYVDRANMTEEEQAYMDFVEEEEPMEGVWVMSPTQVTCKECNIMYTTEDVLG